MGESSVDSLVGGLNKKYGLKTVIRGNEVEVTERVPTGIFELDLALGGGIPRRRMTIIWGQESAGKTNVCLSTLKSHMALFPNLKCVFVDLEHSFDPLWASEFGVDIDNLIVINPDFAEQAVDMIQQLMKADDIGLIIVDSLASMTTAKEFDKSSEVANVGGTSLLTTTFTKRLTVALGQSAKSGNHPTVICINQMRYKIGQMFGNPETQSGGKAAQHGSACTIKLYAKGVKDPKVDVDLDVKKETTFNVTKNKMAVVAKAGKFNLVVYAHAGMQIGETDDWNTIANYLKDFGFLTQLKKGWEMLGEEYATLIEARAKLRSDPVFANDVRQAIIQRVATDHNIKTVASFDGS